MPIVNAILPAPLDAYEGLIIGMGKALAILVLGWVVAKWVSALALRGFRARKLDEAVARFLAALTQYLVIAAALIASLGTVGIETTSLVAVLGSAALAIGLALQGSLSHFASGVMVLVFRPFAIGDVITAGGHTGTVDDIGLFATILVTPDNHKVIIPNAQVTGGTIVNLTARGTRRGEISVGVAYGTDPTKVLELLPACVASMDTVLEDPAPAAILAGFGASSVDFKLYLWANCPDWWATLNEARVVVHDALTKAGIEIPFDQIVVHNSAA